MPQRSPKIAVVVPAWNQARYLAGAVGSALDQTASCGVGLVIVDDGCPDPETARIGRTFADANPDRVAFLRQANAGVAAARNAGVRQAIRRWPDVGAFFFLDADNLLSPRTMAELWRALEEDPELAWASPTLEMFGYGPSGDGNWNVHGPHLPYRQLFMNQSDTGTLVRRTVFASGIEFDETMRKGFEDWEFFLRATLAGFGGAGAGKCGFRYRRVPDSMLTGAQNREAQIKADIRRRHEDAYRAGSLCRREHVEAPRFALVRCDRVDALLLSAADLEPRRVPLTELCGDNLAATAIVLTSAGAIDRLRERGLLAGLLLRLQLELHDHPAVAVEAGGERIATAAMPAMLKSLRLPAGDLWTGRELELAGATAWAPQPLRGEPVDEILDALCAVPDRPTHAHGAALHQAFFQHIHFVRLETTVPWAGSEGGRTLLALAPERDCEGWHAMVERVADARLQDPDLAVHLVLGEAPPSADPPPDGFDTETCVGGADPGSTALLIENLRAGADLIEDLSAAARPLPIADKVAA